MRCSAVRIDTKERCDLNATYVVTFGDGDKIDACQECALLLQQMAQ